MVYYIFRRMLMMFPTLVITSALIFAIIEAPPGDYLSYIAELEGPGRSRRPGAGSSICARSTASTSHRSNATSTGSAACSSAVSACSPAMKAAVRRRSATMFLTIVVADGDVMYSLADRVPVGIYSATRRSTVGATTASPSSGCSASASRFPARAV